MRTFSKKRRSAVFAVFLVALAATASGVTSSILAMDGQVAALSEVFFKICVLSRAGYTDQRRVFISSLSRALARTLIFSLSWAGAPLVLPGMFSLALECYSAGYFAASLISMDGLRGAMLILCIFVPQTLISVVPWLFMGGECLALHFGFFRESGEKPSGSAFALRLLLFLALSIPGAALHSFMTLKLMKLLPY